MNTTIEQLRSMSTAPADTDAFASWLKLEDVTEYLKASAEQNEFVVYAVLPHSFIHAIVVPKRLVSPPDVDDLMSWNCNASSSWGILQSFNPPLVEVLPPLNHTGSKTLDQGEQLVFARRFEGRLAGKSYFEVLQKFVHIFDLHFLHERNAYCRLDDQGDIEDAVHILDVPEKGHKFGGTIVTFRKDLLDEYMALTDSLIIRTFDFTRFRPYAFGGWSKILKPNRASDEYIFYHSVIEPGHASYMRGFQLIYPQITKEELSKHLDFGEPTDRKYASFIAYDWKNNIVREISCAPGSTANYFTKSELPFETSPAFFRPEVLQKYKTDSDKYRLEERSISCRGAWHLQTYDINEAGQVHTYIVYLRSLPYEEQLYWKAHNEEPKAPISKRAFKTDFEGSWDIEYDPLSSLKQIASEFDEQQVPWWTLRSEKAIAQVHYPVTASADEWANEILHLEQLVVEGFNEKWLRMKATLLNRAPAIQLRSLKLVEECLIGLGFEEEHVKEIIAPLYKLHYLRSKLRGHVSGNEAMTIKQEAIKEHGSYKEHFRILCTECDESLRIIDKAFAAFRDVS